MVFWVLFLILMFIPGVIHTYAAIRLLRFIRIESGLASFLLCTANGGFDLLFSLGLLLAILFGKLILTLDFSNLFVFILAFSIIGSFLWWRFVTATHSLWLVGLIELNWFENLPSEFSGIKGWTVYRYKVVLDSIIWVLRLLKRKAEEINTRYGRK